MIKETIGLLGLRAKDKVTGVEGVISSACFDLYGCVLVSITPPADGNKVESGHWFDVARVEVGNERVMTAPDFDAKAVRPAEYQHGASPKMPPRR